MSRFFPGRRPRGGRGTSVASTGLASTDTAAEDNADNIARAVTEFRSIFHDHNEENDPAFHGFDDEATISAEELCRARREIINARRTKYLEEDYFFDMFQSDATLKIEISAASKRKRLQVENKFVRSGRLSLGTPEPPIASDEEKLKSPLIRKPKFELNPSLLQQLRTPSQQGQLYEDNEGSMQSADRTPPRLNSAKSINPAAIDLVVEEIAGDKLKENPWPTASQAPEKTNTRMAGNIVCGICGAVHYYASILQAKKFGTLSCEMCRKFISRAILKVKATGANEGFPCATGLGKCTVSPIMHTSTMAHHRDRSSSHGSLLAEVRCQACWLKLCLISYNLKDELYDQLRAVLPAVIKSQLPLAAKCSQGQGVLPHREMFECNKQMQVSRPLFDGFRGIESNVVVSVINSSSVATCKRIGQNHVIHERLPNGWTKKAVKRLSGDQKGRWDMYLITPDQKILKSPNDLKLYIAKSGAVINFNIVNFSLPKKTAKVDKALQKGPSCKTKDNGVNQSIMVLDESNQVNHSIFVMNESSKVEAGNIKCALVTSTGRQSPGKVMSESNSPSTQGSVQLKASTVLPKSSRRETKIPLKYREDLGDLGVSRRSYQMSSPILTNETKIEQINEDSNVDCKEEDSEKEIADVRTEEDDCDADINTKPSLHQLQMSPSKIGVGAFSVSKDAIGALSVDASISDLKFRTYKRTVSCKKCENCQHSDCLRCIYCLDHKRNGGKGILKKICAERRCLNPQMPGLPAVSTSELAKDAALELPSQPVPPSEVAEIDTGTTSGPPAGVEEENAVFIPKLAPSSSESAPPQVVSTPPRTILVIATPPRINLPASPLRATEESEPSPDARPSVSYAGLITLALESFPHQEGTLAMIYDFIVDRFSYFRKIDPKGWQNSIRHNLSLHKEFVKSDRQGTKGNYWRLAPDACKETLLRKKVHKEDSASPSIYSSTQITPEDTTSSVSSTSSLLSASKAALQTQVAVAPAVAAAASSFQPIKAIEAPKSGVLREAEQTSTPPAMPRGRTEARSTGQKPPDQVPVPDRVRRRAKKNTYRLEALPFRQPFCASMDYWEQYDPDEAFLLGQPVLTTEALALPLRSLCFLCGSAGVEELLFCTACCEPFHPYCLEPSELPQSELTERSWVCRRCAACHVCGDAADEDDDDEDNDLQRRCAVCCQMFHLACLQPSQRKILKSEGGSEVPWTCFGCSRCHSCGKSDVSLQLDGLPLCATCGLQKKQGCFCPLCFGCYDNDDYETHMIECTRCGNWVHSKCEDVDEEKYQILGGLPDSVEFVCKKCRAPSSDPETDVMKAIITWRKKALQNTLTRLMESKWSRPYITAPNARVVQQVGVDSARRALQFGANSEDAPAEPAEQAEQAEPAKQAEPAEPAKRVRRGISVLQKLRREHGLRECRVELHNIGRFLPPLLLRKKTSACANEYSNANECTVMLRDLRHHSWWGPKIKAEVTRSAEKSIQQRPDEEVLDLTGMLKRLNEDGYVNLLQFHMDFKKVCDTVHVPGPDKARRRQLLLKAYAELMWQAFPWFDPAHPTALYESQCPPPKHPDHEYGATTTSQSQLAPAEERKPPRWKSFAGKALPCITKADRRKCIFCCGLGDGDRQNVGRLVYFRQNEWAHVNCALWSSEVYEEGDGGLQNVPTAVNRGAKLACTVCNKRGATTGCCHEYCKSNFHFACGMKDGASYKEDKTVYCRQHKSLYTSKPEATDFVVARIVYIDLESEVRKKSKAVDLRTVRVTMGALTVDSIGEIAAKAEGQFHEDAIVPVGYSCSRLFWSVRDPGKRVRYSCVTSIRTPSKSESEAEAEEWARMKAQEESSERHECIDHAVESDVSAEAKLKAFAAYVRRLELKRARDTNANVLPPYAISEVCSHLELRDLHPEVYGKAARLEDAVAASPPRSVVSSHNTWQTTWDAHQSRDRKNAFDAEMEAVVRALPVSPMKRLNKAVGNVMKRTPIKAAEDELEFEDINIPLEADNDLISAILRDGNFEEELERPTASPVAGIYPLEGRPNSEFRSARVEDSVTVRSWFNQNKKKKVSEVFVQCSLPYTKTNFEMDEEEESSSAANQSDVSSEADEGELLSRQSGSVGAVLSEIDLLNKILAMSADKLLELGTEEQVFELGSELEDHQAQGSAKHSNERPEDSPASTNRILQLDGADEPEDSTAALVGGEQQQVWTCNKCGSQFRALAAFKSHALSCPDIVSSLSGLPIRSPSARAVKAEDPDGDLSPRKDFSIAGLLSPPAQGSNNDDDDDDVMVIATTHKPSSVSPRSTSSPRRLLPKTAPGHPPTPAPMSSVPPAQPQNVFLQQLPTMELAATFPSTFQQATGRSLQYVGGLSGVSSALPSPFMQVVPQVMMPASSGFLQPAQHLQLTSQGFFAIPQQGILLNHQGHPLINLSPFASPSQGTLIYNHQFLTPSPGAVSASPSGFITPSPLRPLTPLTHYATAASPAPPPPTVSFASSPTAKKVARVQPQPSDPLRAPCRSSQPPSDPLKALSSMARQPMSSNNQLVVNRLSITHPTQAHKHRSVGTQARIGGPLKILTPRPWRGSDSAAAPSASSPQALSFAPASGGTMSSGVSAEDSSASSTNEEEVRPESRHEASSSFTRVCGIERIAASPSAVPAPAPSLKFQVETTASSRNAIELVLAPRGDGDALRLETVSVRDAGQVSTAPQPAAAQRIMRRALKKSHRVRGAALVAKLDGRGAVPHTERDFVNEVAVGERVAAAAPVATNPPPSIWRPAAFSETQEEVRGPCVMYKLSSEDGAFSAESTDVTSLWRAVLVAVQEARAELKMKPLAASSLGMTGRQMLGLTHDAVAYLIEQLPGVEAAADYNYTFKHFGRTEFWQQDEEECAPVPENATGCARSEPFKDRAPLDMFSWLASKHRKRPLSVASAAASLDPDLQMPGASSRRATSLDLPMAMRYRHLAKNAKVAVGVFRSGIHGRGLYCNREIQAGEMVIEYAGEEIRASLTDMREKFYESKGIGCYMFKIDDDTVIDATMKGNAARFINHSCDPNCYSKIVDVLNKKHIIIFALRRIFIGEELTYDYKFPIEDVKLPCTCSAKRCRKYLN